MENKKEIRLVRRWFTFITKHTCEEIFSDLKLIFEGGAITDNMKQAGIPTSFKRITTNLNREETHDKVKSILEDFASNETESDDKVSVGSAYLYLLLTHPVFANDLIPILEWYEAIYGWGIPTMDEIEKKRKEKQNENTRLRNRKV